MIPLNAQTLAELPETVAVPGYDRSAVTTGIVHIGVGNFHRSHQARYVDDLLAAGASEWGICGVGVMAPDVHMRDAMAASDCLYTLVTKHADGAVEARVIGSIVDYLYAPENPLAVIERMAESQVRIVSLTVTEGGYNQHPVTGEFDEHNIAVQRDLHDDAVPHTSFGLVVEALRLRRERGLAPFAVMSCDNIPGNGTLARRMFCAFAALKDPELAEWMGEHVAFPNSMVDRITPATSEEDRLDVQARFGIEDPWPVVAEPFTQWVLEDDFPLGRPAWEDAGVQVVTDVEPYELMKLRLLNCSHQALAYFGWLCGYRMVHDVARDPLFVRLLETWMDEAAATLPPVPGVDLADYRRTLLERFANPAVRDTVARLCQDASSRIPNWVLPTVRDNLAAGRPVTVGAAIVASWARYAEATDEQGEQIEIHDPLAEFLVPIAQSQRQNPDAFVQHEAVFGDLAQVEGFLEPYRRVLASLHEVGARATLTSLVGD